MISLPTLPESIKHSLHFFAELTLYCIVTVASYAIGIDCLVAAMQYLPNVSFMTFSFPVILLAGMAGFLLNCLLYQADAYTVMCDFIEEIFLLCRMSKNWLLEHIFATVVSAFSITFIGILLTILGVPLSSGVIILLIGGCTAIMFLLSLMPLNARWSSMQQACLSISCNVIALGSGLTMGLFSFTAYYKNTFVLLPHWTIICFSVLYAIGTFILLRKALSETIDPKTTRLARNIIRQIKTNNQDNSNTKKVNLSALIPYLAVKLSNHTDKEQLAALWLNIIAFMSKDYQGRRQNQSNLKHSLGKELSELSYCRNLSLLQRLKDLRSSSLTRLFVMLFATAIFIYATIYGTAYAWLHNTQIALKMLGFTAISASQLSTLLLSMIIVAECVFCIKTALWLAERKFNVSGIQFNFKIFGYAIGVILILANGLGNAAIAGASSTFFSLWVFTVITAACLSITIMAKEIADFNVKSLLPPGSPNQPLRRAVILACALTTVFAITTMSIIYMPTMSIVKFYIYPHLICNHIFIGISICLAAYVGFTPKRPPIIATTACLGASALSLFISVLITMNELGLTLSPTLCIITAISCATLIGSVLALSRAIHADDNKNVISSNKIDPDPAEASKSSPSAAMKPLLTHHEVIDTLLQDAGYTIRNSQNY